MNKLVISVRIFYAASATDMLEVSVEVPPDATILDAIQASGLLARYPDIDLAKNGVGIFSQRKNLTDGVSAGDRIEIYRPLLIDPKDARRARA